MNIYEILVCEYYFFVFQWKLANKSLKIRIKEYYIFFFISADRKLTTVKTILNL